MKQKKRPGKYPAIYFHIISAFCTPSCATLNSTSSPFKDKEVSRGRCGDCHPEGVEARPIKQIAGTSNFNEVFLTNVRIPDSQRLGEVGEGWSVALTTLMNERLGASSLSLPPDYSHREYAG